MRSGWAVGAVDAELGEQRADGTGEGRRGRGDVGERGRAAEARKVDGDGVTRPRERLEHRLPHPEFAADAVQKNDWLSAAVSLEVQPDAVHWRRHYPPPTALHLFVAYAGALSTSGGAGAGSPATVITQPGSTRHHPVVAGVSSGQSTRSGRQ